jgi:hypothetical protein
VERSTASDLAQKTHPPPKAPFARAALKASPKTLHQALPPPQEANNIIEDGKVQGISARAPHKNNHLQKQKEMLVAKRHRINMQAKVR